MLNTPSPTPPALLSPDRLARDLAVRDLTDPDEGGHAVQLVLERAVRALADRWRCQVRWCRGERVVPVTDNYDLLGYDPADVTRPWRPGSEIADRQAATTARTEAALRNAGQPVQQCQEGLRLHPPRGDPPTLYQIRSHTAICDGGQSGR